MAKGNAMEINDIRKRQKGPDALWWTYRYLDTVLDIGRSPSPSEKELDEVLKAFIKLAIHDPDWAMRQLTAKDPRADSLARVFSDPRLAKALRLLRLGDPEEEAMLRAGLLSSVAHWRFGRKDKPLWSKAWRQLARIPQAKRGDRWKEIALEAAASADYASYRALAEERLASLKRDFWRARFLGEAIPVAARHRDWPTFDDWLAQWEGLPEPLQRDHQECVIINLIGLRALDEGRDEDAEAAMRRLLAAAASATFISNHDVMALPKRLRGEGKWLELCDAFDQLAESRDWRLLDKKK